MPHIPGHIEQESHSCGILRPDGEDNSLYFVPPTTWKPKKGDEVTFLPLKVPLGGLGQFILIAYDVIEKGAHPHGVLDDESKKKLKDLTVLKKDLEDIKN